ncbi:cytokine receptor common subunit gamma-like isoform X2 [Takifugu rubripes]|uniref:cytokine receptor common subunit gamma-like isoform X2 n=2 Tax=Takifugu rubripes TaxID=31033 RepID=UPI0011460907|nr:cytokine receptor common subunit gamma-like isoform X2 [Takifugu rubripes]
MEYVFIGCDVTLLLSEEEKRTSSTQTKAMRLFPVHLTLWFSFLFFRASKSAFNTFTETNGMNSTVCENIEFTDAGLVPEQDDIKASDINEQSFCVLYVTNILNCSWSLDHSAVAHISVCNNKTLLWSLNPSKEERAGSASLILQNVDVLYVVLQFNLTLQGSRAVYTKVYDKHMLEVPPPPENISTSVTGENLLLVSWSLPESQILFDPNCYEYQLDIGDGEPAREASGELSYTLPNVVPSHTHRARIRTRLSITCHERPHWSEWSKWSNDAAGAVEPPGFRLNLLVIVLILLGLPMILLAVLLMARSQRLYKTVFPRIPRPPPDYMKALDKNDRLNEPHPCTPAEEEVITVVLFE